MKNIILMITSVTIGVITLMIIMTTDGRSHHSMELKNNLPSVMEETLYNMAVSKNYSIQDSNELIADLTEHLIIALDAPCDLTIDVLACDKEKGLLSIRVTSSFSHPNGEPGSVFCERTVILDQIPPQTYSSYSISFFVNGNLYKQYTVMENDRIFAPISPVAPSGMRFYGWKDSSGNAADFSQPITGNMTYYADIR